MTQEDEIISKEIISYIKSSGAISNKKWIAWLESKANQEKIDYNEELKKCKANPLYFFNKYVKVKFKEHNPVWDERDEKIYNRIYDLIHSAAFTNYEVDEDGKELGEYANIINWFKSIKDRVQSQDKILDVFRK